MLNRRGRTGVSLQDTSPDCDHISQLSTGRDRHPEAGINAIKDLDEGLRNMMVSETASDEIVMNLTECIPQVQ